MDFVSETTRPSASVPVGGDGAALDDRYELGELIGVGGSALVYRAEDRLLGREVAVKLYPVGVGEPDRVRQRRELTLLAQLNHPNLVKLLDAGEDSGRAFLVMELVAGRTLSARVREGALPTAGPGDARTTADRVRHAPAEAAHHDVHRTLAGNVVRRDQDLGEIRRAVDVRVEQVRRRRRPTRARAGRRRQR